MMSEKKSIVEGTIILSQFQHPNSSSKFMIRSDGDVRQWGASEDRLEASEPLVEAMAKVVIPELAKC